MTGISQYQPPQIMDVYGHDAELAWYRQRNENHPQRRYSPPGEIPPMVEKSRRISQRQHPQHNNRYQSNIARLH